MNNINDQKLLDYKRKKIVKVIIVLLALGVIVLEILALLNKVSMLWGLGLFIVVQILNKFLLK